MRSQCSAISSTARNFLEAGARGSTRRCRYQPTHSRRHLQTQSPAQRSPLSSPLASTPSIPNLSQRTPLRSSPVLRTLNARRAFSTTPARHHGDLTPPKPGEERHVTFIDKEGHEHTFQVADGDNLLDIAQANDLEMEGACGGSCACSTCHVIVQDDGMYDKMEEPSDDENDMLDLAFGLTETSRLGCQVIMSKELDGLVIKLPSMTRNMQASDFADK